MNEFRQVNLYCLAIFNKDTGTARVFAFNTFDEWLESWSIYKDSPDLYPYTFRQYMYITKGHPLFDTPFAEPILSTNCTLRIRK